MHSYFERVEALLRRNIGVSLSAQGSAKVRPAPPTAHGPLSEEGVPGERSAFEPSGDDLPFGDGMFLSKDGPERFGRGESAGEDEDWMDWADLKKKQQIKKDVEHDEL